MPAAEYAAWVSHLGQEEDRQIAMWAAAIARFWNGDPSIGAASYLPRRRRMAAEVVEAAIAAYHGLGSEIKDEWPTAT